MTTASRHLTEKQWQEQVTDLAERLGWTWVHFPTVTTARKNRDGTLRFVHETPYKGPLGPGWPDLVLVRERVVYAELKRQNGKPPTAEQRDVARVLTAAGVEVYLWRPRDFEDVQETLSRRTR